MLHEQLLSTMPVSKPAVRARPMAPVRMGMCKFWNFPIDKQRKLLNTSYNI